MIFDDLGLPKDSGASDYMDSARLAGLLVTLGLNDESLLKGILKYTKYNEDNVLVGMRHPREVPSNNWKNFTRDQLMCLASGLFKAGEIETAHKLYVAAVDRNYRAQNTEYDVEGSAKKFPNGADLLTPSHMGHLRACAGLKSTIIQDLWLILDITYHSLFTPLRESNQLICLCVVAGPKYVKMFKALNSKWEQGIRDYWSGWRGESDLAELLIQKIKEY